MYKERFERYVLPEPNSGCWLWIGSDDNKGYGKFSIKGKTTKAHRASYELYKGCIPIGLHVLHVCDNPICVNPDHLFLGTHSDNMKDRQTKGRNPTFVRYGSNNPASKLDYKAIMEIREKYQPRKYSIRKLAKEYGVSFQLIQKILAGEIWVGHLMG